MLSWHVLSVIGHAEGSLWLEMQCVAAGASSNSYIMEVFNKGFETQLSTDSWFQIARYPLRFMLYLRRDVWSYDHKVRYQGKHLMMVADLKPAI